MTARGGIWHAHPMVPPPLTYRERFLHVLRLTVGAILGLIVVFLATVYVLTLGPA